MVQKQSELTKDSFLLTVSECIYNYYFPTSYILSYTQQFQHSRTPFPKTIIFFLCVQKH